MIFRRFFYGLKEGIRNIFRNKMFSLASIGTIMACIFLLGASFAVILNVQSTMTKMEKSVGISAFFDAGLTQQQKDSIGTQIKSKNQVESIRYVSAEEAWETARKEMFADNEELLEGFEGKNPLNESDSYLITVDEASNHESLVKDLER